MKLKYEKFRNMNNVITIDLHNNYTVIALIGKDNDVYDVQLMLKENTIDNWVLIEQAEHLKMFATPKNIYSVILKQVAAYLNGGFFNYYIERYEYEIKCFDLGNDIYESKEKGGNNNEL